MSYDRLHTDPPPQIAHPQPTLPDWLARRVLRPGEQVTWVRGPRNNPGWEAFATHPALALVALAAGAAACWAVRLLAGSWADVPPPVVLGAAGLVVASILVLGISAAYFTRLVVTDRRLVILQGYEVCRSWGLDALPPSLIRYGRRGVEDDSRAVDLEGLQTLLGNASGRFAESKSIMAFGKQLDRIIARDNNRPRPGPDPAG
jgi:hypothetical protein